jgi:hypothetical protein
VHDPHGSIFGRAFAPSVLSMGQRTVGATEALVPRLGVSVSSASCLKARHSRCLLSGRYGEPAGGRIMHFREEPVTPVYRHWMCEQGGCDGELLSTGEGITRLSTRWKHRCGKCGREDWADATYPRVAYLPVDAIGADDSYI